MLVLFYLKQTSAILDRKRSHFAMTDSSDLKLIAAGNDAKTGKVIARCAKFSQFGTCAVGAYAAVLPASPVIGADYSVRNDGLVSLAIFPAITASGGAVASETIDGMAVGIPFWLSPTSSVTFICTSISDTGSTWWSRSLHERSKVVRTIAAATTLTKYDSGHYFSIDQTSGAYTITLPDVTTSTGCVFNFDVGVSAANQVVISEGKTTIQGGNNETISGATDSSPAVNSTNLNIIANAPVGTNIQFISNGVGWKVNSNCPVTAKVTFS